MPRIPSVRDIYMDEAEEFLLSHSLTSPPRSWRPLAPESQTERLNHGLRKMDWPSSLTQHRELGQDDEPIDELINGNETYRNGGEEERCVICLMALRDRAIVGVCGHEFCFECIGVWANQSRRCPLCSAEMAPFLLHDLDRTTPTKFYLPPLPQRKLPSATEASGANGNGGPSRVRDERWSAGEKADMDELDIQVERRREVYQHELFVKHIGSNPTTHFRPNPTPREIAASPHLIQKATSFLRRELRLWGLIDVEFLTTTILQLIKAIDIRSEPAIRLLREYLDTKEYPRGAEHFGHELYSWMRSPWKELRKWDEVVQYDPIPGEEDTYTAAPALLPRESARRSRSRSPSPISSSSSASYSSRSRSPRRRRRTRTDQRDTFIPASSPSRRQWDEADTWLDPEYEEWLQGGRKRPVVAAAAAAKSPRRGSSHPIELLPGSPVPQLRMDQRAEVLNSEDPDTGVDRRPSLKVKGLAAKEISESPITTSDSKKMKLLERLALAKAEASTRTKVKDGEAGSGPGSTTNSTTIPVSASASASAEPGEVATISTSMARATSLKQMIRARIALKKKLLHERGIYNESKAQYLRLQVLAAKARREAEEKDWTLRLLDREDKRREVRRRLMVEKMKAAETDAERRARELREKLLARRAPPPPPPSAVVIAAA